MNNKTINKISRTDFKPHRKTWGSTCKTAETKEGNGFYEQIFISYYVLYLKDGTCY